MEEPDPIILPIDGTLDLHAFRPAEIKYLVPDYLEECRKKGIVHVRIIHGKGTGTLRRTVQSLLSRLNCVADFHLGDEASGSWGATLVTLRGVERPPSGQPDRIPLPDGEPEA